ncbi:MAG: hypothetical protein ACJA2X_000029 [Halocynthiibacter sp.]|jgi:hypothetical protein
MKFTREAIQAAAAPFSIAERLSQIRIQIDASSREIVPARPGIHKDTLQSYWDFCCQIGLKRIDAFTDFALACHLAECSPETMYTHVKDMRGQVNKGRKAKKAALDYLAKTQNG